MKSRNNEESIFFFGNEFGKNLRHWKAPNSQPQAFPKDSPSDLCHRRYHFSRVSLEKMCVHGCGMTHLFDLLVPLSLWTDSVEGQLGMHMCSFHSGVFFMRKHLLSGLPFCFTATLQAMKWSSGIFICLRKAAFTFLLLWLPCSSG